tara:strand:- start:388 stop:882 length:495 start_codon:yes stop_codon:yes gene_type:complete
MPQLNPEFFISQLFWLVISFTFLFVFLWRISLPRIGSVLEKRANKISEDIKIAKQYQAEAEEIQTIIDKQLSKAKIETSDLIKLTNINIQNHATKELEQLDVSLNAKLEEAYEKIEKNKKDSLSQINSQIYDITKLTISKVSNISVSDEDIQNIVKNVSAKAVN